ncbi:GNAT family N-acetyltransferase [Robiginitalea sp. IMCC44478]|uniref:GNAT family N-acetyltransferase n=1 Tax=Robiginitalea sp. IMCC44478 TaxID=3459122 RepID=UPI00404197A8
MKEYLFKSERLGFRPWGDEDLKAFAQINADRRVMEYFPEPLTEVQTTAFVAKQQIQLLTHGHCYFATDVLESREFIGFIGLSHQEYTSPFTPATDIGWRLKKEAWGKGYATEGARRCLEYGFKQIGLTDIIAVCPVKNLRSENVMKKIGMEKRGTFSHPGLKDYPDLENCVCYGLYRKEWQKSS